jgi:hypothetical protein
MKIEAAEYKFNPIRIIIESDYDYRTLQDIFNYALHRMNYLVDKKIILAEEMKEKIDFLKELSNGIWDKRMQKICIKKEI